jgi:hypothetical protein
VSDANSALIDQDETRWHTHKGYARIHVVPAGILAGPLPALRAYRLSLADGMTVRA